MSVDDTDNQCPLIMEVKTEEPVDEDGKLLPDESCAMSSGGVDSTDMVMSSKVLDQEELDKDGVQLIKQENIDGLYPEDPVGHDFIEKEDRVGEKVAPSDDSKTSPSISNVGQDESNDMNELLACSVCSKMYKRATYLKKHRLVHTVRCARKHLDGFTF